MSRTVVNNIIYDANRELMEQKTVSLVEDSWKDLVEYIYGQDDEIEELEDDKERLEDHISSLESTIAELQERLNE